MTALELRHLSHASDQADGGISVAVSALIASQRALGIQADWLTADSFSPLLRDRALRRSVLRSGASLLHLHGLWRSSTRIAHHLAASGLPLVIAPHGMLDPCALAISRHRKQVVWHLWEHRALRSACCLHALCRAEANAIRALLPNTAIAVIPNGVHLPEELPQGQPVWADLIPEDEHVLLFFGRFHHKKGIEPGSLRLQQPSVIVGGWASSAMAMLVFCPVA
jgi:poly(glycerol-phosphate) alpha-glucosyltransferase